MAAASLGRLTLDLVTKIGNFTGPMTQAERQAKNSSKSIAESFSVASIAATAFGAAVAGVSIGSMVAFADQTIQTGSEIKKFAQLANTSVRDFQFYAKGAETAGISMESFADKMKDMQDRIGDFQQTGGGPLADFFENIAPLVGVTIQQFQKLSGPEALQLYYNSLEKVGASQNDMKFYMEAIISDSSLLLPLLKNGGEMFKFWGDAAERANAIMSDEMIETLALAKINLQLLNLQWDGLKATLVNNVVPVVQVVADNMDNVKAVAFALTAAMAVKLVPTVIATSIQLAQLAAFSVRAGAGLIGLASSGSIATGSMVALRGAMAFLGGPVGLAMLAAQGIAAGAAFAYMKKSSDDLKPSLDSQNVSIQDLVSSYEALSDSAKRSQMRFENTKLSELGNEYDDAKSKLISYVIAMGRFDDSSDSAVKAANKLAMQYKSGEITAEQLASKINALSGASDESKEKIDSQAAAVSKAKSAMDAQQKVVGALDGVKKGLNQTTRQSIVLLNKEQKAHQALTQKQRAALTGIQEQNARAQYIANNMALGWSREKAEYVADYRDEAGLDYAKRLTKYELIQLENGFKVQQQNKATEESEKKIEEAKRKRIELSQKQYSYSSEELKMLQKVAEINSKYGLNEIGSKYGIPENMLAAVMAQESKGNINAKSPTGAIGPFQTTSIFRKQYGLTVGDSYNVPKVADAIARDISKSFEVFGNWHDAITAVNAGAQGTKNLLAKGFTGSAAKTKEASAYSGLVDKWLVGLGGTSNKSAGFVANDASENLKDWGEYWNDIEEVRKQSLERQKNVDQMYLTEEERMAEDNKDALLEIQKAFAGDDSAIKKYTDLQNAAYQKDVAEYQEAQKQKELSDKRQLLEASQNWMTASDYAEQYYALVREEILNTSEYSPEMKDALVKQSINQQGIEQNAEREQVWGDYQNRFGAEKSPYQQDIDLLDKALKHRLVLETEYQQQRIALQLTYGAQYGADFAGMMMGLVDSSSSAYAVLGTAQKAFALYSVMMDSKVAISKAWASAAFPYNMPAVGMAVMQTGLLEAAVSALSPVGFAGGGFTGFGGKYEPAGIVHKGEGVLNQEEIAALGGPAGFFALRDSIRNGFADGGLALDPPKLMNVQSPTMQDYVNQAQQNASSQAASLHQSIINVVDWDEVPGVMAGPAGQKTTLNTISKNKTQIRKMLGIA